MVTSNLEAWAAEWDRLMDSCNVPRGEARLLAFAELVSAYSGPHRHYHNLEHIAYILKEMRPLRGMFREPDVVELAAWYHDCIYEPTSQENEMRSADAARVALQRLGLTQERITRVCELIMFTRAHQAPQDLEAQLFVDLDLSILAAPWRVYKRYSDAIRKEYDCFGDRVYYSGRLAVLERFLQRPNIYQWPVYGECNEQRARTNLAAEIAEIEEILRSLS